MRLAELNGRSVAVWGTGGEARTVLAAVAVQRPSRLLAVDDGARPGGVEWIGESAPLAAGDHAFAALATAEVVVRTAGVAVDHPWLAEIRARGVTITSGSALWMAGHAARTIAVAGQRGDHVTAVLLHRLLAAAGADVVLGGGSPENGTARGDGRSLLELPAAQQYVVELSAEQCADLTDSPRVAVLTGLEGDARLELTLLRYAPELIVVDGTDKLLRDEIRGLADANGFPPVPSGADDSRFRVEDGYVYCSDDRLFPRATLRVDGEPAGRSLCVALAVLDGLGHDVIALAEGLAAAVAAFDH